MPEAAKTKRKQGNNSKSSSKKLALVEKDKMVIDLRIQGANYEQIAKRLGISLGGAHKCFQRGLARAEKAAKEAANEALALELRRLDMMLAILMPQVLAGDQHAMDRVLRIQERRAKYLGLDAPTKVEATGKDGTPLHPVPEVVWNLTALTVEQLEQLATLQRLMVPTRAQMMQGTGPGTQDALDAHVVSVEEAEVVEPKAPADAADAGA